jgi:hypothetical protein
LEGTWKETAIVYFEILSQTLSPDIIKVIRSRRMRWTGHVAFCEDGRWIKVAGLLSMDDL